MSRLDPVPGARRAGPCRRPSRSHLADQRPALHRSYFWWIDIPLAETVRAEIVDTAETLAEFELATGSPRAAARAARAGLMAETSAEQLWRAVMRAEHAAGNLAGVAEAWRRCLDAIEDIAPGGEPHPDTATLYRQLTMSAREQVQVR
jgi:DNA-binding SARP family transcriptional activator